MHTPLHFRFDAFTKALTPVSQMLFRGINVPNLSDKYSSKP
eukprot:gene10101-8203_t